MSTVTYPVLIANPQGDTQPVEVKPLVDTGAMFTCLPTPQLEALVLRFINTMTPTFSPFRGEGRRPSPTKDA